MEGFYINREVGPFVTVLTSADVYGKFEDLGIPLGEDPMLALGINKFEDYTWSDIEHHHIITWSVEIRSVKDSIYYDEINVISIESRILFEYTEPHSEDPIEWEWEKKIDFNEWELDLSDLNWQGEHGIWIESIELNFSYEDWKDKKKKKTIRLSSPHI